MKRYKKYIIILCLVLAFCITLCLIPIDATRFVPVIETQISKELGINVHIDKLIFRFGPSLKIKAPDMHIMYQDGQKFAQFNNVKFFVPWSTLFKDDVVIKRLYADQFIMKISSKDKYFPDLVKRIRDRDFKSNPNITLKEYSINYADYSKQDVPKQYKVTGSKLELVKLINYKNMKLETIGEFLINDKSHIVYDLTLLPEFDLPDDEKSVEIGEFIEQIEALDFYSDIIADLKVYKNSDNEMQFSGLVNIDNISVLDPQRKEPRSFIYLTFLGSKTRILSNIYASGDKKIYADGVINNSKKPEIDLKFKTDEINLSDVYKKIKLLADFSRFKGIETVNGTLKADFSLKGDLNKIKSSGYMKISNASLKAGSFDLNKINSDIDFSNNVINISQASGFVANAPVMLKGKIDKKIDLELLMSKVELKHLFSNDIGVKNGIISMSANIGGTFEDLVHKENVQIDNFKMIKDGYDIGFSKLKIDTNKDNIAYINNLIVNPKNTEFVKLPLLKLYMERDIIRVPDTNIFMPNSKLTAKAEISNYNTKDLVFNLFVDGYINSKDIKINKNSSIYPLKLNIFGNRDTQNIESQIILEKAEILDEPAIINLVSKIENNILKIDDLSISPFSGNFSNNFKSNLKSSKRVIISGNVENLADPILKNIRIFIPQLLNTTFMDTVAQIKGDVFVNGKYKQPEVIGQINAQNLINQYLQLSVNNMTIDFNKNVAMVSAPLIKLADSSMGITGIISTDFSQGLFMKSLNVKSKYINTDTLLMYKDNPLIKDTGININDGKFYSEKAQISIYGTPLYMSALTFDFNTNNNVFYSKNMSSELFNGKIAGDLDFNLRDENYNAKLQARGVSASPIFDIVAIRKDTVSGTMDFDLNLSGNISSKQTLNGNIKFIVHNGRMGTLGKLEHLLYAQNVIADNMLRTSLSVVTKAISLKDTGLFKYLRGDIAMTNGIANIKMLQSQGPQMSLFIKGKYSPMTDYAKLVVLGRLSDEIVSGMGAFGDFSMNKLLVMLTGEDNTLSVHSEDMDKLPQLPVRNTKEFRSVINGILEKPSSVIQFNWISYSQKSYRQKDVPQGDGKVPEFIDSIPY